MPYAGGGANPHPHMNPSCPRSRWQYRDARCLLGLWRLLRALQFLPSSNTATATNSVYQNAARLQSLDPFADSAPFCNSQVVVILKIEPKLRWQTKILSQPNGSVGPDGPISADHFINARKTQSLRQLISTHAHRLHELRLENLSRVHRKHLSRSGHDWSILMVIHDLCFKRTQSAPTTRRMPDLTIVRSGF